MSKRSIRRRPKVLVFGGSFDPPHGGHERLLVSALRALHPHVAYLVPARLSPFKASHQASVGDRLRLAKRLRDSLPVSLRRRVRVESSELRRIGPSYTIQTARLIRRRHPNADLYFLLGSDAFAMLPGWNRVDELKALFRWIVGMRPGEKIPQGLPSFIRLPGVFPPISSTQIRSRLIAGLEVESLVPSKVLDYIRRKRLYALDIHVDLRKTLQPNRYEHSLEVARLAVRLAQLHGLDEEAAALAGILHDAGRRFNPAEMTRYAVQHRLRIPNRSQIARYAPLLQHAFISEDLAKNRFRVHDSKVLSAIRNHTLGAVRMAALDRLLYVADGASADRKFPEAAQIRRMAERDLESGFKETVRMKLSYAKRDGSWLHPSSRRFVRWALSR